MSEPDAVPCPCGSGRVFLECHGARPPINPVDPVAFANVALRAAQMVNHLPYDLAVDALIFAVNLLLPPPGHPKKIAGLL